MPWVGLDETWLFGIGTAAPSVAATVAFGNVQSGSEIGGLGGGFRHNEGAGGADDITWEMIEPTARVETIYKGEALIASAKRTVYNGLPPRVAVAGGLIVATNGMKAISGYINTQGIECGAVGDPVHVSYDILGIQFEQFTATQAATWAVTNAFVWHAGGISLANGTYDVQSFRAELNNNITLQSSLDAKAAASQRLPEWADTGSEAVSLRCTVRTPLGIDLAADWPSALATAVITISNGYTNKVLTLTELYAAPGSTAYRSVGPGDAATWDLEFEAKMNSMRSAATQAWVLT